MSYNSGRGASIAFHWRERTLRNGLKVVAVEMPHVHSVSLVAYVRAGSRYETPSTNGMSHFLEHMFFRGTERFPSTYELAHHIESLGATFNATTTREMAYFYTEIAPRHLESGVETLGEMFRAPLFPDIGIEREVVLEEISGLQRGRRPHRPRLVDRALDERVRSPGVRRSGVAGRPAPRAGLPARGLAGRRRGRGAGRRDRGGAPLTHRTRIDVARDAHDRVVDVPPA
jgi:hypothetical protein